MFLFTLFFFTAAHFHLGSCMLAFLIFSPLLYNFNVFLATKLVSIICYLFLTLALSLLSKSMKMLKFSGKKDFFFVLSLSLKVRVAM